MASGGRRYRAVRRDGLALELRADHRSPDFVVEDGIRWLLDSIRHRRPLSSELLAVALEQPALQHLLQPFDLLADGGLVRLSAARAVMPPVSATTAKLRRRSRVGLRMIRS
ncbi:MAG: hypothetical protein R3D03_14360 [Geminicoccaceae bacterium]